jgi:lipopolysaccharide biosynthesis regulator YciM
VNDLILYAVLVAALAIGFVLGRRAGRSPQDGHRVVSQDYFRGLNYLLNERTDLAIDTFVDTMAVNDDTVATHLALGGLVRRRGEVEKAIRIHQNLLARPVLSASNQAQVELELARDYFVAGLLGRAESLLREHADHSGEQPGAALELLLQIYERERDWTRAVEVARELIRYDSNMAPRIAHYHCELAERSLEAADLDGARGELARALRMDGGCARANLIGAKVEFEAHRYREVLRLLERMRDQDPTLAAECLKLYEQAALAMGDTDALVRFARESLELTPALALVEALRTRIELAGDPAAARDFIVAHLQRHPNLGGFVTLLRLLDNEGEPLAAEHVRVVRLLSEAMLERQARYRCGACGYSGQARMWQCPGCHAWGSIHPLLPGAVDTSDGSGTAAANAGR